MQLRTCLKDISSRAAETATKRTCEPPWVACVCENIVLRLLASIEPMVAMPSSASGSRAMASTCSARFLSHRGARFLSCAAELAVPQSQKDQ